MVEGNHALLGQCREKLRREQRIAGRFVVDELGQRCSAVGIAVQAVRDQPRDLVKRERRKDDRARPCARFSNGRKLAHERMLGTDLIFSVRTDEEKVADLLLRRQIFEQVERPGIEPL